MGYRVVVYSEGNNFRIQRIKLLCLLIEIIIGKYIWLTHSRSEDAIFAVIDTGVLKSSPSKRRFLPHFAIIREQLLSNLGSAIIETGWMYTKIIKNNKMSR